MAEARRGWRLLSEDGEILRDMLTWVNGVIISESFREWAVALLVWPAAAGVTT